MLLYTEVNVERNVQNDVRANGINNPLWTFGYAPDDYICFCFQAKICFGHFLYMQKY